MNIYIVCAGRPLARHEQVWVDEYLKRTQRFSALEIIRVRESPNKTWEDLQKKIPRNSWQVVLDPTGKHFTTQQFANLISKAESSSKKSISFVIGGSYGLPDAARASADTVLSLTPLTLPHRLALLVLTEQIYRVLSWRAGSPYHHV